jgi:hypothetical protein
LDFEIGAAMIRVDESLRAAFSSGVILAVCVEPKGEGRRGRVEIGEEGCQLDKSCFVRFTNRLGVQRGG